MTDLSDIASFYPLPVFYQGLYCCALFSSRRGDKNPWYVRLLSRIFWGCWLTKLYYFILPNFCFRDLRRLCQHNIASSFKTKLQMSSEKLFSLLVTHQFNFFNAALYNKAAQCPHDKRMCFHKPGPQDQGSHFSFTVRPRLKQFKNLCSVCLSLWVIATRFESVHNWMYRTHGPEQKGLQLSIYACVVLW